MWCLVIEQDERAAGSSSCLGDSGGCVLMGRTWGTGLPSAVRVSPARGPGTPPMRSPKLEPEPGDGALPSAPPGASCGTAQGDQPLVPPGGGVGAGWGGPEHQAPQAGRGEGSRPGPDGSGSGAAPREAGRRGRMGEVPAAPRQSPSPFPFGGSDVAGAAGQRGAAVPLALGPALPPRGLSSSRGTGVGAGGSGQAWAPLPLDVQGLCKPSLARRLSQGTGLHRLPQGRRLPSVSNAERPTEGS